MYWYIALVIAIEQFSTIMTIMIWFFTVKNGEYTPTRPYSPFGAALKFSLTYHFGSVAFGSFLVAVIWTIMTMIIVYKEVLKATMSHEKLVPLRDWLIECALWLLAKLKDCVDFGNRLAFIKIAMENNCCFCCALCSGLFEVLANFGKAFMIFLVCQFFSYLGYLLIMVGGAATTFLQLNYLTVTPILGMPTTVPIPYAPIIFTAALSYFMATLFMDIFELAVLTFMFARSKNESLDNKFGPDAGVDELMNEINKQDLSK